VEPTSELYESLQIAYEHFNHRLFEGKLVKVIFTVQRKAGVMGYFAPERWGNLNGKKCHEIAINPSYIANARLIEVMQTLVHEMVHCWQYCYGNPGRKYYHNKQWANKMMDVGLMPSSTGRPGGNITGQQMSDYIIEGGDFLKAFKVLENKKRFQLSWIDLKSLPRLYDPIIANPNQTKPAALEIQMIKSQNPELEDVKDSYLLQHQLPSDENTFSELIPEDYFIAQESRRNTRSKYICPGCDSKVYGRANLNIRCEDCDEIFIQP